KTRKVELADALPEVLPDSLANTERNLIIKLFFFLILSN
ncbi:unnamed protein product, partial [Arabidopsis halleri]